MSNVMITFPGKVFPFFVAFLRRPFLLGAIPSIFLFLSTGCKRDDAPPPPVSVEQLPAALEKVFARKAPESLSSLLGSLREKDYSKALLGLQTLSASSGLSREQVNVVAAGIVSVNNALQEAQSQGDTNAAQTLQSYRSTK